MIIGVTPGEFRIKKRFMKYIKEESIGKILKRLENLILLMVKSKKIVLFKGLIEAGDNGFWKKRYAPKYSLGQAAELFNKIGGKTIIEIGSGIHGVMSGNSILVWARKTNAERIVAIDLEEKHINQVKKVTTTCNNVEAIVRDGIKFLEEFEGTIDLLYLDFFVPDPEGAIKGTGRAKAYLQAYLNARYKMNVNSLILIDDTDHVHPWKHTFIIPEARKDGFKVIWEGRQTLLKR